ncbi:hypothetical protein PTSG_09183 [Salpingoeca rosetta]|uniref:Uncharacterized protein n=1 Tax=Salpingoeca rosetta (strain ATCC 50818 / BSB-021) TaxID=946362 RepID=F2UMY7_SALR5|nr:uncharacterized protein PTSG_09183 [Salpingoeca rosetta]EGD78486.1 hypothetical protein PTSG_09183 [Salpingoeca rosetta]|eukprot:XP_004989435.1 hypothetical protein PTSG_09183 [Salpingoeca rosetta]
MVLTKSKAGSDSAPRRASEPSQSPQSPPPLMNIRDWLETQRTKYGRRFRILARLPRNHPSPEKDLPTRRLRNLILEFVRNNPRWAHQQRHANKAASAPDEQQQQQQDGEEAAVEQQQQQQQQADEQVLAASDCVMEAKCTADSNPTPNPEKRRKRATSTSSSCSSTLSQASSLGSPVDAPHSPTAVEATAAKAGGHAVTNVHNDSANVHNGSTYQYEAV